MPVGRLPGGEETHGDLHAGGFRAVCATRKAERDGIEQGTQRPPAHDTPPRADHPRAVPRHVIGRRSNFQN